MHFVVICSQGRKFSEDERSEEGILAQHIEYQHGLFEAGRLVMGGPFTDDTGGMAILDTDSREEAERIVAGDPAVVSGHYVTEVRPYRIAVRR